MQNLPFPLAAVLVLAHAESVLPAENAFSWSMVGLAAVAYPVAAFALGGLFARIVRRRLDQGSSARVLFRARLAVSVAATATFALLVLAHDWLWCVKGAIPVGLPFLPHGLAIVPFVAAYLLGLAPILAIEQKYEGANPEPVTHKVRLELRALLLPLGPFLLFMGVLDLGWYFPQLQEVLVTRSLPGTVALLGLLATVLALAPIVIGRLWPSSPFPAGPLRDRFRELADAAGVKIRHIRIWHTGRRRLVNACITGAFPRFRTVFLTDGLLESCDAHQLEGVFAHELGHVRHHHFFLFFAVVVAFLIAYLAATPYLPESLWWTLPILAVAGYLYFWIFFGSLSRHCELEADLFAARLTGSTPTFAQTLQQIAVLTHSFHFKKSWRHPAVPTRLQSLWDQELDTDAPVHFRRRSRTFLVATVLLVGISTLAYTTDLIASHSQEIAERDGLVAEYLVTEVHRTRLRPHDADARLATSLERASVLLTRVAESASHGSDRQRHALRWLAECYLGLGETARAEQILTEIDATHAD